jgi:hypothetical protein
VVSSIGRMDAGPQMAGEGGVVDQRDVTEDVGSAPKAATEAKPWKAKKKPWNSFRAVSPANDIEIYEGKVVAVGVRDIEVTSPETGYLCIRCQGDDQFHIPSPTASNASTSSSMAMVSLNFAFGKISSRSMTT